MTGPPPAVARVRVAVRSALRGLPSGALALVACSGGPDSIALAAAAAFEAPRRHRRVGLVTVDHGLQEGSRQRAEAVAAWARDLGFDPVEVSSVTVRPGADGPEAGARRARYAALAAAARRHGAAAVLLAHTLEDQAETCLLALARGAGPRGLAAMPLRREERGVTLIRPLLSVPRATTVAAAKDAGFAVWSDPHNADPRFARPRVRHEVLPCLVDALGTGVVGNLAQTASQLALDTAYLDAIADEARRDVRDGPGMRVSGLSALHPAIRGRVLHRFAIELGAIPAALGHRHVAALDELITEWHGQGPVFLPGGIAVARIDGALRPVEGLP